MEIMWFHSFVYFLFTVLFIIYYLVCLPYKSKWNKKMFVHVILNSNISEGTVTFIKPAMINSSYLPNIYPDHVNLKAFVLILVFLTFFKVCFILLVVYVWMLV